MPRLLRLLLAAALPKLAGAQGGCPPLSTCTDQFVHDGLTLDCKKASPTAYCEEFPQGACTDCTCKPGCESYGGDGTPQDWRSGKTNPLGNGSSANGRHALSPAQQQQVVDTLNFVRAYHGACPVQWSDTLAEFGDVHAWESCEPVLGWGNADEAFLAKKIGFLSFRRFGALANSGWHAINSPMEHVIMHWYRREANYDYSNPGNAKPGGGEIESFVLQVWKTTTHVGCFMHQCDSQDDSSKKKVLYICNYAPSRTNTDYAGQVGRRGEQATGCNGTGLFPPFDGSAIGIRPQIGMIGAVAGALLALFG